jgi:hypothetical protein
MISIIYMKFAMGDWAATTFDPPFGCIEKTPGGLFGRRHVVAVSLLPLFVAALSG